MRRLRGRGGVPARRIMVALVAFAALATFAIPAGALTNSTFESADGDLAPNTSGKPHDWNAPVEPIDCGNTVPNAGTNCGTDLQRSGDDDALGQGAKEDIPNPSVVDGSIPPNKSDLTRFYVNKERAANTDFLYLAWERSNVLGSANMDFEINQLRCEPGETPTNCQGNGVTPLRLKGDPLVRFDFTNGGGTPVLSLVRWIPAGTAGASSADCFKNNALPCWGATNDTTGANANIGGDLLDGVNDQQLNLTSAGIADGAVNTTTVTDTNPPNAPRQLPALTFGEAGINLTTSGIFQPGSARTSDRRCSRAVPRSRSTPS